MMILGRRNGFFWIIIILVAVFLFTAPLWINWSWKYYEEKFVLEQQNNTSLVDYSIANNLKIRKIYVSDITNLKQEEPFGTIGAIIYQPKYMSEAQNLLDSLQGKKINLTAELTLNAMQDTLNEHQMILMRRKAIILIGMKNIEKSTSVNIEIFKETNYTIKMNRRYSLKRSDEYAVLLASITFDKNLKKPR